MMDTLLIVGMFATIAGGIYLLEHFKRCPVCRGVDPTDVPVSQNHKVCDDHWIAVINAQYDA
jgi:hypothetical protein